MQIIHRIACNFSYSLRSPIDVQLLKTPQGQQLLNRSLLARFKPPNLLPELTQHYQSFRTTLFEVQNINKEANTLKKQLKKRVMEGANPQDLKLKLSELKRTQTEKQQALVDIKSKLQVLLSNIGNLVHPGVLVSQDEDQNRILKYYSPKHPQNTIVADPTLDHKLIEQSMFAQKDEKRASYEQLTKLFGIADLSRGQKVSGHRGYFLCANGVKLALALAQYGLEHLQKHGYSTYYTPALILEQVLRESCQLGDIQTDVYRLKNDGLCLIATSQQSLAGFHRAQTLEMSKLPVRMGGYSSCFRREAGAHGKDIHGLFRVHQFQKVQQFVVCHAKESETEMERMLTISEQFYQSLGVPYRLVEIVSGALNDAAYRKIDLQAWYPSQGRFRELVSVSNCTDYQSRMLDTKYRQGKTTCYAHLLNGTLVAIQRTITCLLQHFYNQKERRLDIPESVQPYLRAKYLNVC